MRRVLNAACSAIDSIRINALSNEMRDGREVWVKRRRVGSHPIVHCANLFFRWAGNPVHVWGRTENWQQWEIHCFRLLNGDRFQVFADGPRAVCAENLPGVSLSDHLDEGRLTDDMLIAAAQECRRVHGIWCPELDGPWSHGDAHMANFLYDGAARRARLVDFEVMHQRHLPAEERHADDLLVFLQDMAGRLSDERWLPCAMCFIDAYGGPPGVLRALRERLVIRPGMASRMWWGIRTRYTKLAVLRRRVDSLREALGGPEREAGSSQREAGISPRELVHSGGELMGSQRPLLD